MEQIRQEKPLLRRKNHKKSKVEVIWINLCYLELKLSTGCHQDTKDQQYRQGSHTIRQVIRNKAREILLCTKKQTL